MPLRYLLAVKDFTLQPTPAICEHTRSRPPRREPTVDIPTSPRQITVYATSVPDARAQAHHHLELLHARRTFHHPDSLPPTAADVIYSAARRHAATLLDSDLNHAATEAVDRNCTEHDARQHLHTGALVDEVRERRAERHARHLRSRRRAAATAATAAR
ncbi:hypothetical protein [Streptomyces sp. NBC_00470]|uniref:hypothetical protein n=1 Tax=Streptomyces sp. NBC_00470 TaxID=2975753 RepID=UPI002F911150